MAKKNTNGQWLIKTNGDIYSVSEGNVVKSIPEGSYSIQLNRNTGDYYLVPKYYSTDTLIPLGELTNEIITEVDNFWKKLDVFKEYKMSAKKGILLYGPPGSGKSSLIGLISKNLVELQKGVIIHIDTSLHNIERLNDYITSTFRKNEPERPLCIIIENIHLVSKNEECQEILINLMDGTKAISNVLWLMTTNYPEQISELISKRAGRVDKSYEIAQPNIKERGAYFYSKLTEEEIKKHNVADWCVKTEGLSFASLAEIIRSVIILEECTLEEKIKILKENENIKSSTTWKKDKLGFSGKTGKNKKLKNSLTFAEFLEDLTGEDNDDGLVD